MDRQERHAVAPVDDPLRGALARELGSIALAEGYHVLLCNSERDPARELKYGEELLADGVSGVVHGTARRFRTPPCSLPRCRTRYSSSGRGDRESPRPAFARV
ncbi:hypothetical protein ACIA8E_28455 [Streptomyces sp. NPDC051664]|uniref:hypothetical protein n=1 Tax=Streptomyces sp. NPDC051664 TaxID=3365668 RepID=UPI0037AAFE2D